MEKISVIFSSLVAKRGGSNITYGHHRRKNDQPGRVPRTNLASIAVASSTTGSKIYSRNVQILGLRLMFMLFSFAGVLELMLQTWSFLESDTLCFHLSNIARRVSIKFFQATWTTEIDSLAFVINKKPRGNIHLHYRTEWLHFWS